MIINAVRRWGNAFANILKRPPTSAIETASKTQDQTPPPHNTQNAINTPHAEELKGRLGKEGE